MLDYSDKIKDHFFNPKNAGPLADANAVGEAGALSCGDALKLMLKVDPLTEVILDARFQTFGCGSAIASSSALTELIIGKTIVQAAGLTNQQIAESLGGLPPEKMHCAVLGHDALQAAIANFRGEAWTAGDAPGALICKCSGVGEGALKRAIRMNRLTSVDQLTAFTKAGAGCFTCYDKLEAVLAQTNAELVAEGLIAKEAAFSLQTRAPRPAPAAVAAAPETPAQPVSRPRVQISPLAPSAPAGEPAMTNLRKIKLIEETIEELRPFLRKDGGDCELIDVDGSNVLVKMSGACVLCKLASATISGIQEKLVEKLGVPLRVIPVGKTPFGKVAGGH
ncbi:Fe-S cluster assembly protein NifU [Methylocella silvestris]|nr:Fe-S cluster assembly protein NifU [Methylocella silvestris]